MDSLSALWWWGGVMSPTVCTLWGPDARLVPPPRQAFSIWPHMLGLNIQAGLCPANGAAGAQAKSANADVLAPTPPALRAGSLGRAVLLLKPPLASRLGG